MKALRTVFPNGVGALNAMVIDSPADAMRAVQLAIREERVALGEPTDRTAISIEDTIKREYERWMTVEDEESDPPPRPLAAHHRPVPVARSMPSDGRTAAQLARGEARGVLWFSTRESTGARSPRKVATVVIHPL